MKVFNLIFCFNLFLTILPLTELAHGADVPGGFPEQMTYTPSKDMDIVSNIAQPYFGVDKVELCSGNFTLAPTGRAFMGTTNPKPDLLIEGCLDQKCSLILTMKRDERFYISKGKKVKLDLVGIDGRTIRFQNAGREYTVSCQYIEKSPDPGDCSKMRITNNIQIPELTANYDLVKKTLSSCVALPPNPKTMNDKEPVVSPDTTTKRDIKLVPVEIDK